MKFSTEKVADMEQKLENKNKEIDNNKTDTEKRKNEIDLLNGKIKENREETDELIKKIKSLETQLLEVKSTPKVLERIKEILNLKGFLSDRELDEVIKEFE